MDASSANTSESSDEGPESSSSGVVEIQTMAVPQESQRLANHPTLLRLLRSGPQDEDVVNETISGVRNKQATEDEEAAAMDTDSGCSNGTSSNIKTPSRRRTASKRSIAASRRHGRKLLTLQQKLDVIRRMKEGEKAKSLAAEYDIARTTVWQFRNQESQITDFISKIPENSDGQATNRSSMRRPRVESVEKELRVWMATEQANGNVVNNRELRKMARTIHQQLSGKADDDDDARAFKASSGWLRRFKRRNGIQVPKPFRMPTPKVETPEDVQVHLDLVRKFVGKNGIDAERVYTVDKMRLHWRALPLKSSPASDDFVEVLLCINSTGTHRLRLALIGHGGGNGSGGEDEAAEQSAMPFRRYCAQKVDVTLDADSFAEWFRNEFVPAVSTSPHRCPTLLLVNAFSSNVGLHSTLQTDDSAVRCVVLSSAAAFVTQPVNLALVKALGCNYRKSLVPTVIANRRLLENPKLTKPRDIWIIEASSDFLWTHSCSLLHCNIRTGFYYPHLSIGE